MASSSLPDVQRRLDDLLEHLPAGVVVHGADGRILRSKRLACKLLGRSGKRLHGTEASASAWRFVCTDGGPMSPARFPVAVVWRTWRRVAHLIVGVPSGEQEPVRWLICNAYPERDATIDPAADVIRAPAAAVHVETVACIAAQGQVACETLTRIGSVPGIEIVRAAQEHGCDLILMGAHGPNDANTLYTGSVAQHVLAWSPILVLMLRDPREASPHASGKAAPP